MPFHYFISKFIQIIQASILLRQEPVTSSIRVLNPHRYFIHKVLPRSSRPLSNLLPLTHLLTLPSFTQMPNHPPYRHLSISLSFTILHSTIHPHLSSPHIHLSILHSPHLHRPPQSSKPSRLILPATHQIALDPDQQYISSHPASVYPSR